MYKTKSGKTLNLTKAKEIASGGEGRILEHPTDKSRVVKIYHSPRKASFAKHLETLSSLNKDSFVAPKEIYFDDKGNVAGFDMDYVNFNDYWLFNNLFNKGFCNSNNITDSLKLKILAFLKASLEELHKNNIVIGDLNMYNIFVGKTGKVLFVDVDSYQTDSQPHSGVLLDEIRDWTTAMINKSTDAWAYDILAFWTTTYCHPFKWVIPGNKESLEQRVKSHKSYLSNIPGIKIPALYQPPKGEIEKQFRDIFSGRRYMVDFGGVHVPVSTVVKQKIASTSLTVREISHDISHINACTNSVAVRNIKDGSWLLISCAIGGQISFLKSMDADQLYPAGTNFALVKGNDLIFSNNQKLSFYQPQFYYHNGSLVVFDYATDQQRNIDLYKQQFGIDSTSTVVFTKSIILRDTPIQNFGGSVYLNLPQMNRYNLVKVPKGLKNAFYAGPYLGTEVKTKSRIEYTIYNPMSPTSSIDLDYLPHFCSKGDNVFVPENGHIAIYQLGTEIARMDLSICTRDSRLYMTDAGILMLESNTLYLLNKAS
jgi:hypothetical protein